MFINDSLSSSVIGTAVSWVAGVRCSCVVGNCCFSFASAIRSMHSPDVGVNGPSSPATDASLSTSSVFPISLRIS